jgi:hypothetical protein
LPTRKRVFASNSPNTDASVKLPARTPANLDRNAGFASDWRGGSGENYEEDQNQDRENQRASAQEYDFAHHIGLQ